MKNYLAFFKKEFIEYAKTYKLFIMLIIFIVFGITNPLMAKLLPEILSNLITDGITLSLPEATAFDSWTQFFKNATQMGLMVMVILFSNVLSSELSKGTLINLLTKGLSRTAVILAKYTCMVLVWTISLSLCFGLTYGYTLYLFPKGEAVNLIFSTFCLWLFGNLLLAILLLSAVLTKSNYGCLLITGGSAVIGIVLNIIPAAHKYNPISLTTDNLALLTNTVEASSLFGAIIIAGSLSIFFVAVSVHLFQKKQL